MDTLLQHIVLMGLFAIITFGLGIAMRFSAEMRLIIGGIIGFVAFGIVISAGLMGVQIHIEGHFQTFIWFAFCMIPLGFIVAPWIIDSLETKSEQVLGSDRFDKTYRKYAQRNAERNKERAGGFRWHDAQDYHEWRKQSQTYSAEHQQAREGAKEDYQRYKQDQYQSRSQGRNHRRKHAPDPTHWMPEKDKMFSVLGLSEKDSDPASIKSAYRKLARKYHPDILASKNLSDAQIDKAMKKMQEINTAYDWLQDNGYA